MTTSRSLYHTGLAVAMMVIAFVGFWPFYFGPLLVGTYDRHWLYHLHGAVFMGWTAMLIVQSVLVHRRRTKVHMKVGKIGFGLAAVMVALGFGVTFFTVRHLVDEGIVTTPLDLFVASSAPLMDITQFAILIGLGWANRRRMDFHKRYMVLATVAILPAATARMGYLLGPWSMEMLFVLFAAVVIGRDLTTEGRIHRANVIGLLILLPRALLSIAGKYAV